MNPDYIIFSLRSIRHRKLRSYLTIVGIIIGIASIIALVSISDGLQNAIEEQFEKIGSSRLYIMPKGFTLTPLPGLTTDDVDRLKRMSEVEWTNPYLLVSDEVEVGRETKFVQNIVGLETEDVAEKYGDMDFELEKGRWPLNGEKGVAVIGYRLSKDFFKKEIPLKSKIKIKERDFKIIAIMEEIGNSEDDNAIMLPMEDVRELYDKPDEVAAIELKLKEGIEINEAADKIFKRMKKARDDENFEVITPEQLLEQIGQLTGIITVILGGIAAISLVVGGVGIMNSMYTSVLERTREIGVMKAVGATNNTILLMFLVESGMVGLLGGVLGALLGTGFAFAFGAIVQILGFSLILIQVEWILIFFVLAFSFGVGVISGTLPAYRASKLQPVDALRYE